MNRLSSVFLLLLLLVFACLPKPKVIHIKTGKVVDTSSTSATVQGEIIDPGEGITEHGHCWSTSPKPTFEVSTKSTKGSKNTNGTFTSELQNLIPGNLYYVRAYATDGNGPTEYGEELEFRTYGIKPVAAFSASDTNITEGESVQFTDQSTNNPISWSWDFGDGSTSTEQNPSHRYNTAGNYTVKLTANNAFGSDTETKTNYIIVVETGSPPVAAFSASKTSVAVGKSVQFTDQSTNNPTSWSWDFGDGSTSTEQNPSHIYSTAGTYTVKLTATNQFGSDTETKTNYITVDNLPSADFSASKTSVAVGESVQFTDQSTNNPTSWSWDFGDGNTSTEQNPSHNYSTAGTYTVKLTATNQFGSDTETKTDYITVDNLPSADFSASKTSVAVGESVQFTDHSTNNPTSWSWDFGDGSTSTEQNPSHIYSTAGTYTVKLTATNQSGSDTETKSNYITVGNPPTADFSASKTSVAVDESVQFTDQSTNNPTNWSWDFGDGGTSTLQNPSHPYSSEGTYTVTLTVSNDFGTDIETKTNYIIVGFICGTSFTDTRDGISYGTVQIGNQCWMAENLNVGVKINGAEEMTDNSIIEKYCYSDNTDNCDLYGGLYQWDEMMQYTTIEITQGVCPDGWHIPSDYEWKILEIYLGMGQDGADSSGWRGSVEGGKLKAEGTIFWTFPNTGATNSSLFTALPAGGRNISGELFDGLANWTDYWTSTHIISTQAWYRLLDTNESRIYRIDGNREYGTSVRCVKD